MDMDAVHDAESRGNDRGFTLIELLVVVIVIGILAAIAVPVYLNQRRAAWKAAVVSDVVNTAKMMETLHPTIETSAYHSTEAGSNASSAVSSSDGTTGTGRAMIAADAPSADEVTLYRVITADSPDKTISDDTHAVVSSGDTVEISQRRSLSYRIVGSSANVQGWWYVYESDKGAGSWSDVKPDTGIDGVRLESITHELPADAAVLSYRRATAAETALLDAHPSFLTPISDFSASASFGESGAHTDWSPRIRDVDGSYYVCGDTIMKSTGIISSDCVYTRPVSASSTVDVNPLGNGDYYFLPGYANDVAPTGLDGINDGIMKRAESIVNMRLAVPSDYPMPVGNGFSVEDLGRKVAGDIASCDVNWMCGPKSMIVRNYSATTSHAVDITFPDGGDSRHVTLEPGESFAVTFAGHRGVDVKSDDGFTLHCYHEDEPK